MSYFHRDTRCYTYSFTRITGLSFGDGLYFTRCLFNRPGCAPGLIR
nr:MAG TPA: hypothetical protein [Caudoviricetes sp.]